MMPARSDPSDLRTSPFAGGAPARSNGQLVPSVLRAVRILNALAAGPASASLASLSRRLQLPRSSTLALCNTLVESELLVRDPAGTYRLGPHVLDLSRSFLDQTDLHSEFSRVVAQLNVLPEQTVSCAVLRDQDVVYVGRRAGTYPLGVSYEIGMRLPAHCTASGLAMLSALADDELRERYTDDGEGLITLTARSVSSLPELLERVVEVRARGYAVDDEETAVGMLCIGASVRGGPGGELGSVAVSMAKATLHEREIPSVAADITRLASEIAAGLGAQAAQVRRPDGGT
jgi:DNA-binding IclR family transcriptional regulator